VHGSQTAHVHLLTDHPLGALRAAEALLASASARSQVKSAATGGKGPAASPPAGPSVLSPQTTLLARLYAAEALGSMGRPAEAAEHLTAAMMDLHAETDGAASRGGGGGATGKGGGDKEREVAASAWEAEAAALSTEAAKAAVYVNLAAVYATQREWSQAHQCAAQVHPPPSDVAVHLTRLHSRASPGWGAG
jgi:hypothetical protein